MQLASHPDELDLVAQLVDEVLPLELRPARIFQLAQDEIGAAVFFQDRDALRLGRMRGDHRADAQGGDELLDLLGVHAGGRGFGQHLRERALDLFAALLALDLAAAAHGRVLLGDGHELEQDALRLQRARHQLRG